MSILDHLFVLLFAVLYPLAGAAGFHRFMQRIRAGQHPDRLILYRNTIISHWTLLALGLLVWLQSGRSWEALGLGLRLDTGFAAGAALTLLGIAFLMRQLREVASADSHTVSELHQRLGNLEFLLPRTRPELGRFYRLSVTAGIVEEILWRGFLMWYLLQFMPLAAAGVVCTLAFGLAHGYQGRRQLPLVTLVGGLFVVLYVLTGSVWMPIVMHAAIDILQGRLGYELRAGRAPLGAR